jgi:hypothetical protein
VKCNFHISNPGTQAALKQKFNWAVIGSLWVGHFLIFSKEFREDEIKFVENFGRFY